MTSIMTNSAAMAALSTLRSIASDMETTQNRVSSGYRVESAADNSAYWSIATTMRSDTKALETVTDALGLGAAMVDITYTAMDSSVEIVDQIKAKMVAAMEPGVDKNKIQLDIDQLQEQLLSIATSASFAGENWLYHESGGNTPATVSIVGSFNRNASGLVSLTTLDIDTEFTSLIKLGFGGPPATSGNGILSNIRTNINYVDSSGATVVGTASGGVHDFDLTGMTSDELLLQIQATDLASEELADAASTVGALKSRIDMQEKFVKNLIDSIDTGVGRLVDADMNDESTRLKALQTQQQLGIQSLSIANTSSQSLLQLYT
ncbi:flagellin [uncultured Hoeflea sp.]|jgi:flagellin|uniref:flagellin N-terminal helical domain-containing protein n=1 Tax=uncultured Hoeflea sp. TaxID=538666 RepID=UPI0030D797FD|tara:strand:- start:1933 stop:2892 length:960 start_codon:yes stop_codon:yes gene_type:complete